MIYTKLTNKAMKIAYEAHKDQVDKAGIPYIFHPYHLAEQMDDEVSTCVALLHDVVEDTDITFDKLQQEFPNEVIEALKCLTHDKDEPYLEYVQNVKKNEIAIKVKLADIEHNSNQQRLCSTNMNEETREYFRNKYKQARQILLKSKIMWCYL